MPKKRAIPFKAMLVSYPYFREKLALFLRVIHHDPDIAKKLSPMSRQLNALDSTKYNEYLKKFLVEFLAETIDHKCDCCKKNLNLLVALAEAGRTNQKTADKDNNTAESIREKEIKANDAYDKFTKELNKEAAKVKKKNRQKEKKKRSTALTPTSSTLIVTQLPLSNTDTSVTITAKPSSVPEETNITQPAAAALATLPTAKQQDYKPSSAPKETINVEAVVQPTTTLSAKPLKKQKTPSHLWKPKPAAAAPEVKSATNESNTTTPTPDQYKVLNPDYVNAFVCRKPLPAGTAFFKPGITLTEPAALPTHPGFRFNPT